MEKIVNTKEELKEAIKNREQSIVIGSKRLAKKIMRFRKELEPKSFRQQRPLV